MKHLGEYNIDLFRSGAWFKDLVTRTEPSIYIDLMDINIYLLRVRLWSYSYNSNVIEICPLGNNEAFGDCELMGKIKPCFIIFP